MGGGSYNINAFGAPGSNNGRRGPDNLIPNDRYDPKHTNKKK